ncbi:hypothetical protein PROFUN_02037 [Planoprotostelium fungivorum]|uniref:FAM192A/Fyv6 N-terminal domain-containing protein n=1 Tax=Planoprotostelium fungivorum TaxID=1890364 RepID=A0A2P6NB86_9EUKA|nr:hypothetical protein PROFUN_02037 [Planoprotostelium fungivorum]
MGSGGRKKEEKSLKEVLEDNKRKAEDQFNDAYKLRGPKPLDDDEADFLQSRENEKRLKVLERELEDMAEIEQWENDIRTKVYKVPTPTVEEVISPPPTSAPVKNTAAKKVKPKVVIKKKETASSSTTRTDGPSKGGQEKNGKQDGAANGNEKEKTAPAEERKPASLSSLISYGDDDDE